MCGWIAAIMSMVAFGSFGVPIKSKASKACDIDPLVMQTYKTGVCFLTSWLVLFWEPFDYTPWGIVSGLFWVPGGVATVFAIKNAGLAIAIGVGASFIVLVSFTWGIFVFHEHVHDRLQACLAIALMLVGLAGMAYYSAPSIAHKDVAETAVLGGRNIAMTTRNTPSYQEIEVEEYPNSISDDKETFQDEPGGGANDGANSPTQQGVTENSTGPEVSQDVTRETSHIWFCGVRYQRRFLGIMAAMFNGCYGGSIMVPMKFAPPHAGGASYVISFAIGASIVTTALWALRYLFLCFRYRSPTNAYAELPSFHFQQMWLAGGLCGLCWSIGNVFSILSVMWLGEGVGYSAVQLNLLVSGLWGIFYYHEVEGKATICKWFLSAVFAVGGILLLSYEHHVK
jgi:glucose uptake protein GlcU